VSTATPPHRCRLVMVQIGDLRGSPRSVNAARPSDSGKVCSVQISHTHFRVEFPRHLPRSGPDAGRISFFEDYEHCVRRDAFLRGLRGVNSVKKMIEFEKTYALKSAGFVLLHSRDMWFSRDARKAFSHQAIRDHDLIWLKERFADRVPAGGFYFGFYFYFNQPEGKGRSCFEILGELKLALQPEMPICSLLVPDRSSVGPLS
jgi:hypothetical protein